MPAPSEFSADGLNNKAVSFVELGRFDQALELFNQAIAQDPSNLNVVLNRDRLLCEERRITDEEAILHAEIISQMHDKSATYWERLGGLYAEHGNIDKATTAFGRCHNLGGKPPSLAADFQVREVPMGEMPLTRLGIRFVPGTTRVVTQKQVVDQETGLIVSGSYELLLADLSRKLQERTTPSNAVHSVSISPDARLFVTTSQEGPAKIWCLSSFQPLAELEESLKTTIVVFVGDVCVGGGSDNILRMWDTRTGRLLKRLSGHRGIISAVAVIPDSGCVLSSTSFVGMPRNRRQEAYRNSDDRILLWNITGAKCMREFRAGGPVTSIAAFRDRKRFLSARADGHLCIWDIESARVLGDFVGHQGWVTACALTAEDRYALSGGADRTVRIWDVASQKCVATRKFEPTDPVVSGLMAAIFRSAWSCSSSRTTGDYASSGACSRTCACSNWTYQLLTPRLSDRSGARYYLSRPTTYEGAHRRRKEIAELEAAATADLRAHRAAQAYQKLVALRAYPEPDRSLRVATLRGQCLAFGQVLAIHSATSRST